MPIHDYNYDIVPPPVQMKKGGKFTRPVISNSNDRQLLINKIKAKMKRGGKFTKPKPVITGRKDNLKRKLIKDIERLQK